jgi:prepilin-type N-terminal cleavage/methylation domain-containing protein
MLKQFQAMANCLSQSQSNVRGLARSIIQRGFTLLEMVVTLSIIALFATLVGTLFGGDTAKATKMLDDLVTIKKGVERMRLDTGKYPCNDSDFTILTSPGAPSAQPSAGCLNVGGALWAGPYIEKSELTNPGPTKYKSISDSSYILNLTIDLDGYLHPPVSGYKKAVAVVVSDVPPGIAAEFMKMCTGVEYSPSNPTDFSTGNCHLSDAWGIGTTYTVIYLVALLR